MAVAGNASGAAGDDARAACSCSCREGVIYLFPTMPDEEEGGGQMCKCTQCGDGDGCKIPLGISAIMFGPLCVECDPVPHDDETFQKRQTFLYNKQERERRMTKKHKTSTGSDDIDGKKKKRSAD